MKDFDRRLGRLEASAPPNSEGEPDPDPIIIEFIETDGSVAETLVIPIQTKGLDHSSSNGL